MAQKEIYRLDIKVGVSGDSESKNKLTAVEKMTQQIEKRTKTLDKLSASPSIKIKDNSSNTINKLKSKAIELNRTKINPSVRITDNASNRISQISSKLKRLESTNIAVTLRINDQTSTYKNKVQAKSDKLKSTNVNPTAKTENASDKINNVKQKSDQLKDKKIKIQAVDEASKTVDKIQSKISGWIKTAAKKVITLGVAGTVALGGLGIGSAVNTFSKFEQGLSNVKAVTNATDAQMKQLSDTAKSLGASTTWSASAVTEAEQLLGQAGYSANETITALPGLLSLASAGSLDLSSATSIASSTLRGFNLDVSKTTHVADALALTANATNSDVTDLGESLKYISPVANALGISMEDAVAATGLLSNQAIVGSQAGTVLRQTMARLASPTKEASTMMKQYGINAFDAQGNMKPLSGVVNNLNSSLGKLTSQKRADVISTIFGTESMSGVMALMNQGGQSLSDLSSKLEGAKGAANKMAETKMDNLLGQWEQLKGAAETMQINLGEKLAPYAKQFVTWLTDKMPEIERKIISIVDYISKHTNEIKSMAEAVIGIGVAFTALSAAGKIRNAISGISSLVTVLKGSGVAAETAGIASGLSNIGMIGRLLPAIFTPAGFAIAASVGLIGAAVVAENDLMKKSITTTTEELGPLEKVMNELNGHLNKSRKEMVAAGLIYDDFGEGVSDNFKKAAQDSSKNLLKLEMNINRLTKSDKFDDANNNQLKNWVNDMAYEGINAIKEKQSQVKSELQKTFSLDGVTSAAEQGTLDYMDKFFGEGVNRELEIRNEMYAIGDKAIKDHGKLLEDDLNKLKEKAAELQQIKLEYANAESAGEQAYAKSKFTSAAERVTGVNSASELLQERAKEHQKAIDDTKANYDATIAKTQYHLDNDQNLSDTDRTNLQNAINENKTARDKALKEAEDAWKSDLETLYQAYPKAKGLLNEDTGAKFSSGEIVSRNTMDKIQQSHSGLNNITKSGVYALENNTTHDLETLYVSIDETTGKIKGLLNGANGDIGAYSDSEKEKLFSLQDQYSKTGSALQSLLTTHINLNNNDQVFNGAGSIIGELQNVQTATDGTKTGILDLNGTPVQITADASGAILSITEVNNKLKALDGTTVQARINLSTTFSQSAVEYGEQDGARFTKKYPENYLGTDNASAGINSVGERGMELVLGRRFYNFKGGEKVINNKQTTDLFKSANSKNNEPFQVKQGQYQLAQPQQVKLAGVGGNNVQVDVQVNSGQDVEGIIVEVTQKVGQKLREAFDNIKK